MGNAESSQGAPERPPKPLSPTSNNVYPQLGDGDDYEILRPGPGYSPSGPIRPAPKPPGPASPAHPAIQHQTSTHTLGNSSYSGLEGVPFTVNPKFLINSSSSGKFQLPNLKTKTMQQILKEYDYPFTIERQVQ